MPAKTAVKTEGKPSPLVDTRVIYCGDNLEQLKKPVAQTSPLRSAALLEIVRVVR
jgi:hypothetical protein